jgi:putative heme degradation protein
MFAFRTPLSAPATALSGRLRLPVLVAGAGGGDDAVRLRADWPAVLAMTGYARRATWLFGHRAAALECVEGRQQLCRSRCGSGDRTTVRLDFGGWMSVVARRDGGARMLDFFSTHGSPIAAVRLDEVSAEFDELIWLLADDGPPKRYGHALRAPWRRYADRLRQVLPLLERREDFDRLIAQHAVPRSDAFVLAGPYVATAVATDAVGRVLEAATAAGIRVRVRLENHGGSVCWTPTLQATSAATDFLELRSRFGRLHVSNRIGPTWVVHLSGAGGDGPSLEAECLADGGWVRVDVDDAAQRDAWREICMEI